MYRLDITIPGLPKMITNMKTKNWRATHYEKRKWTDIVKASIDFKMKPQKPLERATLICERHSSRPSDFDNRVASFKGVVDGLVEAGVLADDSDDVIIDRKYPRFFVRPKDGFIRIIIEDAADQIGRVA